MLAEHDNILKNRQTAILDLQRTLEDIARRLDEEEKKDKVQQEQPPKVGYTYDEEGNYLGYMNARRELFPTFPEEGKEPIVEYADESDEEIIPITETKMDIEVPPPVPQVTIYDFGSDSDITSC